MTEATSIEEVARQQIEAQSSVDLDSFSNDKLARLEADLRHQLEVRTEAVNTKVKELRDQPGIKQQTVTPDAFGPETRRLLEMGGVDIASQMPIKFETSGSEKDFQLSWEADANSIGLIEASANFVHGELLVVETRSGPNGTKFGRTIIDAPMAADQGRHEGFWKQNPDEYKKALRLSDAFMEQSPFKKLELISELTDFALKSPTKPLPSPAPAEPAK